MIKRFCLETSMGHFAGVFHPKTSFIFSVPVPLSTQDYKWAQAICLGTYEACDWLGHSVIDWYPALSGVVILYQLMLLKLVLTAWAICFWAKIYLFREGSSFRGKGLILAKENASITLMERSLPIKGNFYLPWMCPLYLLDPMIPTFQNGNLKEKYVIVHT